MIRQYTYTPVLKGQRATFEVDETGWHNKPVPDYGLLAEAEETTIFVPESALREALAVIEAHRAKKVRR